MSIGTVKLMVTAGFVGDEQYFETDLTEDQYKNLSDEKKDSLTSQAIGEFISVCPTDCNGELLDI